MQMDLLDTQCMINNDNDDVAQQTSTVFHPFHYRSAKIP